MSLKIIAQETKDFLANSSQAIQRKCSHAVIVKKIQIYNSVNADMINGEYASKLK